MLEFGKDAEYFEQLADECEGLEEIPAPLLSRPLLPAHTASILNAFFTLSAMRTASLVINPITAADALAYVTAIPICDPAHFLDFIQALDVIWLADSREANKTPEEKPEPLPKNGRRNTRSKDRPGRGR